MNQPFLRAEFARVPIVGILRGVESDAVPALVESARLGGLTNLEITLNTPGATSQIRSAVKAAEGKLNIGAGTVTSLELLESALEAGANFIVTPTLVIPVIKRCVNLGVPVFPGALTPTEILQAWELGATLVKVFPAEGLGPAYIKSLKAPLPHVGLMPTGGVDLQTMAAYVRSGASGFGIGSPLFRPERLSNQDWNWVQQQSSAFVAAYIDACSTSNGVTGSMNNQATAPIQ